MRMMVICSGRITNQKYFYHTHPLTKIQCILQRQMSLMAVDLKSGKTELESWNPKTKVRQILFYQG